MSVGPKPIRAIEDLRVHLQAAIELEHATIPPYLTALYSIRPGFNAEAAEIIRSVAVQEMLHMILAANVLNAVGGAPVLTDPRFVPTYPARLPVGREQPVEVGIRKFSLKAVETFLAIERPAKPKPAPMLLAAGAPTPVPPGQLLEMLRRGEIYSSIGNFYQAIEDGLRFLEGEAARAHGTIFTGDLNRQVRSGAFYDSGGDPVVVSDLKSALEALSVIVDQGEGYGDTFDDGDDVIFHEPSELAHFWRFNQIALGRRYKPTDKPPGPPTGDPIAVDYGSGAVYDMGDDTDPTRYADPALRARADAFAREYSALLRALHRGFNGAPDALVEAVPLMFRVKDSAVALMRNPAPGTGHCAGPCYRYVPEE